MSTTAQQSTSKPQAAAAPSLLAQAIKATKQTSASHTTRLLTALTDNAKEGLLQPDNSIISTLNKTIDSIDALISTQLSQIMQHKDLLTLEGSWRGLSYLVNNSACSTSLKIKLLDINKKELHLDLTKAGEFDQSQIFKKIYESEYGTPGGEPYSVLLGDYAFSHHPHDIDILRGMSGVAAAAFCPFIASADAPLFGFDQWQDLSQPRDLAKIFDTVEYSQWNSFRQTEDARFVTLTMPRVLARLPYGQATHPINAFAFEEHASSASSKYCWMNAAYALGTKLTSAYSEHGWCTAIRGAEGGGKVADLPMHCFKSDDGDIDSQCPTEIGITDRREAELSQLGFLPLCHYKNTDYAVFFGAESTQKAKQYDTASATANAAISARLPYIMATSRFAHYLKIMARDKIGSFMEVSDVETWLNRWISQYVNGNPNAKQALKAKYPLAQARVVVNEIAGKPGSYNAVAWLQPWLQMEALSSSMRLVAKIPDIKT